MTSSGSGPNSGQTWSNFGSADDVSMTLAKRLPDRDAQVGTVARVFVTRRRLSCACRRLAARPASSGDVPPINFLVSTSRFQICNNIQLSSDKKCRNWTKTSRKKQTKNVFFFACSDSNLWQALIPNVGHDIAMP